MKQVVLAECGNREKLASFQLIQYKNISYNMILNEIIYTQLT